MRRQVTAGAALAASGLVIVLLSTCGSPAGSGHLEEQSRPLDDFHAVAVDGAIDTEVTVGPACAVKVRTDDNLLPDLQTRVADGELTIRWDPEQTGALAPTGAQATVWLPWLDAVSASGNRLAVHNLAGESLAAGAERGGHLSADGRIRRLAVVASDTAVVDLLAVQAEEVVVTASGQAQVRVDPVRSLELHLSGSASLYAARRPDAISEDLSGQAQVSYGQVVSSQP